MESSAINTPHPDDPVDEAELFFGGEDDEATEPVTEPDPTPPAESAGPTEPEPEPEPEPDPTPAPEPEAASAPAEESGPETPVATNGQEPAPEPETSGTDSDASDEKKGNSGPLEREYLVFHKVPLTERALKFLLSEIEKGKAPEPRVAYLHVHTTTARNVNGAVADAYTKHRTGLGDKCDLAAVSSRSFQEKHVEPKQVVEQSLSIT